MIKTKAFSDEQIQMATELKLNRIGHLKALIRHILDRTTVTN